MLGLRDISIRNKLVLMQVFTSVLVLGLCFAAFVITDINGYKEKADVMGRLVDVISPYHNHSEAFQVLLNGLAWEEYVGGIKEKSPEEVAKAILEKVEKLQLNDESLQRNLDIHLKDTDTEIGDLQNLRMEVSANTEAIKELRKTVERQTERATDRFAQAMQPILVESQNFQTAIKGKSIIRIKESFWEWVKKKIRR